MPLEPDFVKFACIVVDLSAFPHSLELVVVKFARIVVNLSPFQHSLELVYQRLGQNILPRLPGGMFLGKALPFDQVLDRTGLCGMAVRQSGPARAKLQTTVIRSVSGRSAPERGGDGRHGCKKAEPGSKARAQAQDSVPLPHKPFHPADRQTRQTGRPADRRPLQSKHHRCSVPLSHGRCIHTRCRCLRSMIFSAVKTRLGLWGIEERSFPPPGPEPVASPECGACSPQAPSPAAA